MANVWYYEFPVGRVGIAEDGVGICAVFFPEGKIVKETKRSIKEKSAWQEQESPLIKEANRQLREYFDAAAKYYKK